MSRKRTIVGSWPHRRPLRGREAVERALAHAKVWGRADATSASRRAWYACNGEGTALYASWLPPVVRVLCREQLERLLAGEDIEVLAGQPMGIDEVAP